MSVNVTKSLIDDAVKSHSGKCMIAEAVKKAFPGAKSVSVDMASIRFSDPEKWLRYSYMTPRLAQMPLVEWDQGVVPEPFHFVMASPHVTRMANHRPSTAGPRVKGSKTKVERMNQVHNALAKSQFISASHSSSGSVPQRIGGKIPPKATFANRRGFGLRLLGRGRRGEAILNEAIQE